MPYERIFVPETPGTFGASVFLLRVVDLHVDVDVGHGLFANSTLEVLDVGVRDAIVFEQFEERHELGVAIGTAERLLSTIGAGRVAQLVSFHSLWLVGVEFTSVAVHPFRVCFFVALKDGVFAATFAAFVRVISSTVVPITTRVIRMAGGTSAF